MSAGYKFKQAIANNRPLQVAGTIHASTAMMAEKMGHQAIYLSGAGVANAPFGSPDVGIVCLDTLLAEITRLTGIGV